MPALTMNLTKFNTSLAYDSLTLYFNFKTTADIFGQLAACQETLRANVNFNSCANNIQQKNDFDRYIHRQDDDHNLYHQDQYEIENSHSHMKFKFPLTRNKVVILLDTLTSYQLISTDENTQFLAAYDKRQKDALFNVRSTLSGTKNIDVDTRAIINYIHNCHDNDILENLHQALLAERFNYLRTISSTSIDYLWQGTNADGKLTETSKQWAMIQKAFSLQLANNIKAACGNFSPTVAKERGEQLKTSFSFFALKRKNPICSDKVPSSMYQAFYNKDIDTFSKKYEKHFKKY